MNFTSIKTFFSKWEAPFHYLIIGVCLFFIVKNYAFPTSSNATPMVDKGDTIENLIPLLKTSKFENNLVLAISPTCTFCEQSMSFYKELVGLRNSEKLNVGIMSINSSEKAKQEEMRLFNENELKVDAMGLLNFKKYNIMGVPSLMVVNSKGNVEAIWRGYLNPERAQGVKDFIRKL